MHDNIRTASAVDSFVSRSSAFEASVKAPHLHYAFECLDKDGNLKWTAEFDNLVTTAGLNYILGTGAVVAVAKYLGLVDGSGTPTFSASDTIGSHTGWTENTDYTQTARGTITWGSASAGSMSSSSAVTFSINATATIAGAFSVSDSTKGGTTTGTIYSEGAFTGGNKSVASGDTLNVSITLSFS